MSESEMDKLTPPRTQQRKRGNSVSAQEKKNIQHEFLKSFSMTANVRAACLRAGISRTTLYKWLEHDVQFSIEYKQASLDADDMIRAELFRRAVQGYEKPVVSMGKLVYDEQGKPLTERMYSDALLALLARARMQEFRDKQQVEHSGSITVEGAKDSLLAKLGRAVREDTGTGTGMGVEEGHASKKTSTE